MSCQENTLKSKKIRFLASLPPAWCDPYRGLPSDQVPTCPFPHYSFLSPDHRWRDLLPTEELRGGEEGDQGQEQEDRGGAGDPAGTLKTQVQLSTAY